VHATAGDMPHVSRLAREDWRSGKVAKIGFGGSRTHFMLPAIRQGAVEVKGDPSES
jgi:hypothetical protein